MVATPSQINKNPARKLSVTRSAIGSEIEKNPTIVSSTPSAVNHPQPLTPNLCNSKEFTNWLMPENSSHTLKINGSDNRVKP